MSLAGNREWLPYKVLRRVLLLPAISQSVRAGFFGAMDAAINLANSFDAVTDYLATTMGTGWRQHVNRAFEAVKGSSFSGRDNLKRLVVIVSTNITLSHNASWLI